MLHALRRLFGPRASTVTELITDLQARVSKLEGERLEREAETADLKDFLTRHYKRIRQRERRDSPNGEVGLDPITRMILARRGALPHGESEE